MNPEAVHGSQVVAVGTPLPTASLPLGAQQGPVMVGIYGSWWVSMGHGGYLWVMVGIFRSGHSCPKVT